MEKIVIQGHPTRGEDVIKILESLGGSNIHNFSGRREDCYYFIDAVKRINLCSKKYKLMSLFSHMFYTLEEYERKNFLNNMEKRNIQINLATAKEWYKQGGDLKEIALQAFSEEELNDLPTSWEEYYKINPYLDTNKEVFPLANGEILPISQNALRKENPGVVSSKERAEQFLILNKLLQIRDYYNQGWEPDWNDARQEKFVIGAKYNKLFTEVFHNLMFLFAFKTKELRDKFFAYFKEDLELIKEFL